MIAIGSLLDPHTSRLPVPLRPAQPILVHLSQPKRRALVREIGFDEVPEAYLKASYGVSWAAVQADLRALVNAGVVVIRSVGGRPHYSLDLSQFPRHMAASMFSRRAARAAVAA